MRVASADAENRTGVAHPISWRRSPRLSPNPSVSGYDGKMRPPKSINSVLVRSEQRTDRWSVVRFLVVHLVVIDAVVLFVNVILLVVDAVVVHLVVL